MSKVNLKCVMESVPYECSCLYKIHTMRPKFGSFDDPKLVEWDKLQKALNVSRNMTASKKSSVLIFPSGFF